VVTKTPMLREARTDRARRVFWTPMKTYFFAILLAAAAIGMSACSSSARIGTENHHVSVGGSAR
jgi:hypothetical protein